MTPGDFWIGVGLGLAVAVCCYELGDFLATCAPVRKAWTLDRPSSLPAYQQDATKARSGVWDR
jgi:hypothetical protein